MSADNPDGQAFLEQLGYHPRRILMTLRPDASGSSAASPDAQDELADL